MITDYRLFSQLIPLKYRAGVKEGARRAIAPLTTGQRGPALGPGGPTGVLKGPRFGHFNVFARKTAILTKNDTFGHANEGGPAPREGGPAPGKGGPAGTLRPLPPSHAT